jgi:drug/metabolite transporter (DMT)-like permease
MSLQAAETARADDLRGGLYMFLSGLSFAVLSSGLKELSHDLPTLMVGVLRNVAALACFAPLFWRRGFGLVRTDRWREHFLRSAYGYISFLMFVYALPILLLADAIALSFTTPLWSLLLSGLFMAERIPPTRWVATAIGFAGVLLIAKPGSDVSAATAIALLSAVLASLAMIKVKQLSRTEPPERIAFYFMFNGLLIGLPIALPVWQWPDARQWLLVAGVGGLSFLSQICLVRGYALGTFSKMAPMDFLRLPLGIVSGFALFGELPDLWSVTGMAIVVAATLFIMLARERKRP